MTANLNNIIPQGYKRTDIGIIPETWEVKTLGEVGEVIIGLTYSPSNVRESGILVLRSSNIQNNVLEYDDNVFVDCSVSEKLINKEDDILICVRNGSKNLIGKCALIKGRAIGETFGAFMSIFRSQYNKFIVYVFQSDIIKKQIDEHLGATINQITNKSINSFQIPLPPLPEQQRIAQILSDTDALIQQLDALIAKKQAIKQGTMQELLRPKEGWEVKTLGEVAEVKMGQSPLSQYYNKSGIGLPLIQGNADIKNRKTIIRAYTSAITKRGALGDLIMSVRAPVGEIAKAAFNCCLGRGVCAISFPNDYLYHYLIYSENGWEKYSSGSTFDSVNSKQVKEFKIFFPPLPEQQHIAQILSDMDKELEQLGAKRDKYAAIKTGLMQSLLTGAVRV